MTIHFPIPHSTLNSNLFTRDLRTPPSISTLFGKHSDAFRSDTRGTVKRQRTGIEEGFPLFLWGNGDERRTRTLLWENNYFSILKHRIALTSWPYEDPWSIGHCTRTFRPHTARTKKVAGWRFKIVIMEKGNREFERVWRTCDYFGVIEGTHYWNTQGRVPSIIFKELSNCRSLSL